MTIYDLITQPLFWTATMIGSIAMSIVANMLTPCVASRLNAWKGGRQSRSKKQAAERLRAAISNEPDVDLLVFSRLESLWLWLASAALVSGALVIMTQEVKPIVTRGEFASMCARLVISWVAVISACIFSRLAMRIDKEVSSTVARLRLYRALLRDLDSSQMDAAAMEEALDRWDKKHFGITRADLRQ